MLLRTKYYILDPNFLPFIWHQALATISWRWYQEFAFPPDSSSQVVVEVLEISPPDYSSPADYSSLWRISEILEAPFRLDSRYREAARRLFPRYCPDEDHDSREAHEEPPMPRKRQGIVPDTASKAFKCNAVASVRVCHTRFSFARRKQLRNYAFCYQSK